MQAITYTKTVDELEPGDCYLWGEVGESIGSVREVLGIIVRSPRGILLEVRKQDGNVTRSLLSGVVTCIRGAVA